ncbi:MAG: 50S ribosomal protein L9 [Acidimicrobiia bacterium]
MKIVLTQDVASLGTKGSIVSVADGYARNYLIPRGFAIRATKGAIKQAEDMKRAREAAEARARAQAESIRSSLEGFVLKVPARVGKGGKLFGSVTPADIASALFTEKQVEVDRKHIELAEPIRQVGDYEVTIKLHPEVVCKISVSVREE